MDGGADTSGLAGVMTYGTGAGNTITHAYGGTVDKPRVHKNTQQQRKHKSKKKKK